MNSKKFFYEWVNELSVEEVAARAEEMEEV